MIPESNNSNVFNPRCAFLFPKGRRCRLSADPHSLPYCSKHASLGSQDPDTIDFSGTLLSNRSGLQTPEHMQDVLGRIFLLLAQGRLTTKRAAVLTYTVQQLLRTVPAIEHKQEVARKAAIESDPDILLPPHLREIIENKRRIGREAWAKNHPEEASASPDAVRRPVNPNSGHLAGASHQAAAQPAAPQAQTVASTNTVSADPASTSNPPALVRASDLPGFGAPANWDVLIPSKPAPRRRRRIPIESR